MTTVNIPDDALLKAMRAAPTISPEDVVIWALEEFSRQHGQSSLIKHLGTFDQMSPADELRQIRESE